MHKEVKKFITQVTLAILNVDKNDFGTYQCVAKNPLGESDGTINLSGIPIFDYYYFYSVIDALSW